VVSLEGRATPPEKSAAPFSVAPPAPPRVIGRVEALVQAGNPREAVILAYRSAEEDVRRAFSLTLPPRWTHREFVRHYLRADMGAIAALLPQLYAIFEPVRYGRSTEAPMPLLTDLLTALYQEPALRRFVPSSAGAVPGTIGYGFDPKRPVPATPPTAPRPKGE
jgi:hypothetical protein